MHYNVNDTILFYSSPLLSGVVLLVHDRGGEVSGGRGGGKTKEEKKMTLYEKMFQRLEMWVGRS